MADPARILYCHCAYARIIPPEVKTEVLTRLASSSVEWDSVPDLCEMAARRDPHVATLISGGALRIAACYPRVVRSLFQAAGAPLPPETQILNMRTETPAQIIEGLLAGCEKTRGQTNLSPTANVESVSCESRLWTDPSVPAFFRSLL